MQTLKQLRKYHNLSQRQVAEALHMDQASYSRLESSSKGLMSETIIALAEFYQVSCDMILGYMPRSKLSQAEELIMLAGQLVTGQCPRQSLSQDQPMI